MKNLNHIFKYLTKRNNYTNNKILQFSTNYHCSRYQHGSKNILLTHKTKYITSYTQLGAFLSYKDIKQKSNFHTNSIHYREIIQFNLADIGEGIREVIIKEWNSNIKEGNSINEFDILCEVESDKATVSITSRYSGIIKKIYYKEGETAYVGKPLIDIEINENETENRNKTIKEIGNETLTENSINVKENVLIKEIETKLNITNNKIFNDNIKANFQQDTNKEYVDDENIILFKNSWKILATPSVRRMIKYYNINTKNIKGTGKHGRILKEDIIKYMNTPVNNDGSEINQQNKSNIPDGSKINQQISQQLNENQTVPIKSYVKSMFKSMTESNAIPTLRLTEEINTNELALVKNELNNYYSNKYNIKLTYMPFFIKALSHCIQEHPILNSSIDPKQENIILNASHNICIAIDSPRGLVVPNIKNVNKLNIIEISKELIRLQMNALEGKLSPYDLQSGTICISNVGNIGGKFVQPIIVPQQTCIIGFGKIYSVPRFDNQRNVISNDIINLTWAADHRVIDGATIAKSAQIFKQIIEKPTILLAN